MKRLRTYFNSLSPAGRVSFLADVGTSESYIRKAICVGTIGPRMAIRIERATNGLVTRAELRPDIFGPIDANSDRAGGVTSPPSTGEPPDGGSATNRLQEVDG
jgi:DNA-binding transcriptional regulator YdaS (Cro superfamily)